MSGTCNGYTDEDLRDSRDDPEEFMAEAFGSIVCGACAVLAIIVALIAIAIG